MDQRRPVGGSCPPRQPAWRGSTWQGTGAGAQRAVKVHGAGGDLRGPGPVWGSWPADRVAVTPRRLRPESSFFMTGSSFACFVRSFFVVAEMGFLKSNRSNRIVDGSAASGRRELSTTAAGLAREHLAGDRGGRAARGEVARRRRRLARART